MALVPCSPASAESDEQRKNNHARRRERDGAQTDRDAADNTARAIGNQDRVTTGHTLEFKVQTNSTSWFVHPTKSKGDICSTAASAVDGELYHTIFHGPTRKVISSEDVAKQRQRVYDAFR